MFQVPEDGALCKRVPKYWQCEQHSCQLGKRAGLNVVSGTVRRKPAALLPSLTCKYYVRGSQEEEQEVEMKIDPCADVSLIDQRLAVQLECKKLDVEIPKLQWLGS